MQLFDETDYGIDLLAEVSFGWFIANKLAEYDYFVAYRSDGTTPVNVINGFAWIDDLERKNVVRRRDYTNYKHQIPLPIISYDFLGDTANSVEIGSWSKTKTYGVSMIICAENKAQLVNITNFLTTLLEMRSINVINYNVDHSSVIGVISCEDIYSTKMFDVFPEGNIAKNYSSTISFDAFLQFNNQYPIN